VVGEEGTVTSAAAAIVESCAIACMYAHDDICRCWCGGLNHGKHKREWLGYFCEDCGFSFGTNLNTHAWYSCGTSRYFLTKAGNPQSAYWCRDCYEKQRAWLLERRVVKERIGVELPYDRPNRVTHGRTKTW